MDKEQEDAQKLTKDDLVAKLERGRPAKLTRPRRSRDLNKLASEIVREAVSEKEPPSTLGINITWDQRVQYADDMVVRPITVAAPQREAPASAT